MPPSVTDPIVRNRRRENLKLLFFKRVLRKAVQTERREYETTTGGQEKPQEKKEKKHESRNDGTWRIGGFALQGRLLLLFKAEYRDSSGCLVAEGLLAPSAVGS